MPELGCCLGCLGWGEGSCKEGRTKEPLAPPYRVLTLEAVVCPAVLGQLSGLGGNTGVGKTEPYWRRSARRGRTDAQVGRSGYQVPREGLGTVREMHNFSIDILVNLGGFSMPVESAEIPTVVLTATFLCRLNVRMDLCSS